MLNKRTLTIAVLSSVLGIATAHAQSSAGRGAPDPLIPKDIVGSEGKGYFTGAGIPADNMPVVAARDGATPAGITPLPKDIFSTKDFYQDKALWTDKRYFRCNSPQASEVQRGILTPNPLNSGKDEDAPWGHCDRDLPREAIVSPYPRIGVLNGLFV